MNALVKNAWVLAIVSIGLLIGLGIQHQPGVPGALNALAAQPLFVLFAVLVSGLLLGRIEIADLSLGASGVLFTALAAGHFHLPLPGGVGKLGLALFVYCVGLAAGPTFFNTFRRQGKKFAQLSVAIVLTGAATAWALGRFCAIPADLSGGLLAGALTSTPALAASIEAAGRDSNAAVGFGVAYPFGVIGVVLLAQLLPRLLRVDLDTLGQQLDRAAAERNTIVRELVEIVNPTIAGKTPDEVASLKNANVAITRRLIEGRLVPIEPDYRFKTGDHVTLIAAPDIADSVIEALGRRSERTFMMDTEYERRQVVVTAPAMLGKPLRKLKFRKHYSVTVSRITRQDVSFVPSPQTRLQNADQLTVVGMRHRLDEFTQAAGHRPRALDVTDIVSLCAGIAIGIAAGMIKIPLPGGGTFSLGMTGGPLLTALLLGHFGVVGPIAGYMPRPSRLLLNDIGLILFLAASGVQAGASFMTVLAEHGPKLVTAGAVITVAPVLIGYPLARYVFKLNMLEALGGICGGMTSTPGLGAITAKTDAQAPVIGYAAAYPVALILMTLGTQAVVTLLVR